MEKDNNIHTENQEVNENDNIYIESEEIPNEIYKWNWAAAFLTGF